MWEHGNQIALTGFWHVSTQQVTAITLRMIYLNAQFFKIYIYMYVVYICSITMQTFPSTFAVSCLNVCFSAEL